MEYKYRKVAVAVINFLIIMLYSIAWDCLGVRMLLQDIRREHGIPYSMDVMIVGPFVALICVILNRKFVQNTYGWIAALAIYNIIILYILRVFVFLYTGPDF